jgi:hypothetical protein
MCATALPEEPAGGLSCAHGEMLHLLDYNGGQFLDGALHVFVCREQACEMAFVTEF